MAFSTNNAHMWKPNGGDKRSKTTQKCAAISRFLCRAIWNDAVRAHKNEANKIVNCAFVTFNSVDSVKKYAINSDWICYECFCYTYTHSVARSRLYVHLKPNRSLYLFLCISLFRPICFRFYSLSYISVSLNLHCLVDEKMPKETERGREKKGKWKRNKFR